MITGILTGIVLVNSMIIQYTETALAHARYDMINDEESFYGEVPNCPVCGQPEKRLRSAAGTSWK